MLLAPPKISLGAYFTFAFDILTTGASRLVWIPRIVRPIFAPFNLEHPRWRG